MFGGILSLYAADLRSCHSVKLLDDPANDGDSFHVEVDGRQLHIRLYYVDCPETTAGSMSDARRVREQARYFGISSVTNIINFGNEAKAFTGRVLSKPFTLNTAFASALGRSSMGRVYGFVTTFDGDDLASLLVANGLARCRGIGRVTPAGVPRDEMIERLRDMETSAVLRRIGIWAQSDPDRIAELRAEQRIEDQELKQLQRQVRKTGSQHGLIDLNIATKERLMLLDGIGSVSAEKITAGRPYSDVDDLIRIKGINIKTIEKIRSCVVPIGNQKRATPDL